MKATRKGWGPGSGLTRDAKLRQRFPTLDVMETAARRAIPRFAYDFMAGGTGSDLGVARNRTALDRVELVPRYGVTAPVDLQTPLFGTSYAAPFGIAPVGMDCLIWPGATRALARAAAKARVPYCVGTLAGETIEQVVALGGDCIWMQLYGVPGNDHAVTLDLMKRAAACGVKVLVATLDAPVRSKRPRDLINGLTVPFRLRAKTVLDVLSSPRWLMALARAGQPRCANMEPYAEAAGKDVFDFVQEGLRGTFTWAEMARLRAAWPGALLVKGVMHPADAAEAIRLGCDGIVVSNHGGRQFDAAPAAIDVLPAIAEAVSGRAEVLFDSGIRSGLDLARVLACGARAGFGGRAFLIGLAAMGDEGAGYVCALLAEELRVAMGQAGAADAAALRALPRRHPARFIFEDQP